MYGVAIFAYRVVSVANHTGKYYVISGAFIVNGEIRIGM
jgi:hypothetical protein